MGVVHMLLGPAVTALVTAPTQLQTQQVHRTEQDSRAKGLGLPSTDTQTNAVVRAEKQGLFEGSVRRLLRCNVRCMPLLTFCCVQVTLGSADVSGVDFTAFRTSARSSLTAALSLELPAPFRASVKGELFPASASGVAVPGSNPSAAGVFDGAGFLELRGIKQGSYVLKLSCGPAAAGGLPCETWEKPVQVRRDRGHVLGRCQGFWQGESPVAWILP